MQTFDQSLFSLYEEGLISYEDALRNADSLNDLRLEIKLHGKEAKGRNVFSGIGKPRYRARSQPGYAPVAHPSAPARAGPAMTDKTDFGYELVPVGDKARRVRGVFDSVAGKYDLMNDLMSAGLHRLWKRFTVEATRVRPGMRVLDLAGGTGDLALQFARRVGASGEVVLTDINGTMLAAGRDRLVNEGLILPVVQCDAECLPFPTRTSIASASASASAM
jgi:hypothetical protein